MEFRQLAYERGLLLVLQEEFQHRGPLDRGLHGRLIALQRVQGAQDAAPLDRLEGVVAVGQPGTHVDDARRHVRAFEVVPEPQELPAVVVGHVARQEALELLHAPRHALEHLEPPTAREGAV